MIVIYEITATVDRSLAARYERYMIDQHIPDLLATGHFGSATIARSGNQYQIQYKADSRAALDEYLAGDAARLREDFRSHFPNGVDVFRATWEMVAALSR